MKKGRVRLLLVTTRDSARWIIPKGWPMPGIDDATAAAVEAEEEAGVAGTIGNRKIGSFRYEKVLASGATVKCRVHVYPLEVTGRSPSWKEAGERRRRWCSPRKAVSLLDNPDLASLVRSFARAQRRIRTAAQPETTPESRSSAIRSSP